MVEKEQLSDVERWLELAFKYPETAHPSRVEAPPTGGQ